MYKQSIRPDELYHYGVIGMKWGKRKNNSFSKQEVRSDNKTAFKLGREATTYDRAYTIAQKKVNALEKKRERNSSFNLSIAPDSPVLQPMSNNSLKLRRAIVTRDSIKQDRDTAVKNAYAHQKALIAKYGEQHVSSIKTDKHGRVNERVASGKEWAASAALTLGTSALGARKIVRPSSKNKRAKRLYKSYQKEVKKYVL